MGSFVRQSDIAKSLSDKQKAVESLADKTKGPSLAEVKEKAGEELDKAITSQLPEEVLTAAGPLSYNAFKARFEDVYAQVSDKSHLMTGRVTHTYTLSGMSITMRSLRNRERAALLPLLNPGSNDAETAKNDVKYRTYLLTLAVARIGDVNFPDLKLTPDTLEAWLSNEKIKQAEEFLSDMDESFFTVLFALFMDLNTAKHYALIENLKNH
jgi:hypothetical protein